MKVQPGQQRTIIGFSFIWKVFYSWRHFQKHISQGDASTDIRSVDSGGNGMAAIDPMMDLPLHRVFSPRLDPEKCWYALNSSLCCSKPSVFCSTVIDRLPNLFPMNTSSNPSTICMVKMELPRLPAGFVHFEAAKKFT